MSFEKNNSKIWFIPNDFSEESFGPFSFNEIKEKLESGALRFDNFIWSAKLTSKSWSRIIEVEEFKALMFKYPKRPLPKQFSRGTKDKEKPKMNHFFKRSGEYGQENLYRRYPRVALNAEAIIHNNHRISRGRCVDFSEMGMFINLENLNLFEKGEEVIITLREVPSIETFSVNAAIIRVLSESDVPGYALHFLRVQPRTRRLIAKYVLSELEIENRQEPEEDFRREVS